MFDSTAFYLQYPFLSQCLSENESHSVMSNSLRPRGLDSPWNSPGQDTEVGIHSLLQEIFPIQGSNPGLHIAGRRLTVWATRVIKTDRKASSHSWNISLGYQAKQLWYTKSKLTVNWEDLATARAMIPEQQRKLIWQWKTKATREILECTENQGTIF